VRAEAAWVLVFAASKDAARQIATLVEDPDAEVRHAAVWILGRLKAQEFREAIAQRVRDRNAWVRSEAVLSLARLGGKNDAAAISERLSDPDRKVRVKRRPGARGTGRREIPGGLWRDWSGTPTACSVSRRPSVSPG
jgi:HEAT repeat protein